MAAKIFFLVFTVWALKCHQTISFKKNPEYKCADFNFWCNSSSPQPCCNASNSCREYSIGVTQCVEKKHQIIGSPCTDDDDCENLMHLKCSEENVCVCKPKTIYRNNKCSPTLGGFCWHSQDCITPNSICINRKCQCKPNSSQNENHCLPHIIGERCEDDEFCSQVKFAKCMENIFYKICNCWFNTTAVSKTSCVSVLNGFCLEDADCLPKNSFCENNKCRCTPDFTPFSKIKCAQTSLNGYCTNDDDCSEIKNSECSINKLCICKTDHVPMNEKTCGPLIFGPCAKDKDCTINNTLCVDNICQCKPGSISKFANNTVCGLILDEFCNADEECGLDNSVCVDKKCQCNFYSERQSNKCIRHLGHNCTSHEDCSDVLYTECSLNNTCECTYNYDQFNETLCVPLLDGHCSRDEDCIIVNSFCSSNRLCQCKLHFESFSNDQCRALYLNQPCKYNDDCDKIDNTICSNDKKCVCQANYSAFGKIKCLAHVGEYCINKDNCVLHPTVICSNNRCQCIDKFVSVQSNDYCVPVKLGRWCRNDTDCSLIKNAKCTNNICTCRKNYFALNDLSCRPALNGLCSNNNDCVTPSSVCINNKCQCHNNSSAVSSIQCVPNALLYSCNIDSDCGDPWHSKCLENKKCGCNTNGILVDKSTCLSLIGGLCWTDRQCATVQWSFCDDFHCRCAANAIYAADNACFLKNFLE